METLSRRLTVTAFELVEEVTDKIGRIVEESDLGSS